jgi:flagellar biosynthesis/type III secretory pathway protein FliH
MRYLPKATVIDLYRTARPQAGIKQTDAIYAFYRAAIDATWLVALDELKEKHNEILRLQSQIEEMHQAETSLRRKHDEELKEARQDAYNEGLRDGRKDHQYKP